MPTARNRVALIPSLVRKWRITDPALAAEMLGAGQLLTMDSALTADTLCQLANRCRAWFGADLAIALGPFPAAAAADSVPEKVRIALADHQGRE